MLLLVGALNWAIYGVKKIPSTTPPLDLIGLLLQRVPSRFTLMLQLFIYFMVGFAGIIYLLSGNAFGSETSLTKPLEALPIPPWATLLIVTVLIAAGVFLVRRRVRNVNAATGRNVNTSNERF